MEQTPYHELIGTGLDIARGVINAIRRVLSQEEPANTGGGPALDRALYDQPVSDGGRWDDMGNYTTSDNYITVYQHGHVDRY